MIVLAPLLIVFFLPVIVFINGYNRANVLSESLILVDAAIISVEQKVCGSRIRDVCFRMNMLGSVNGINHVYRTTVSQGYFYHLQDRNAKSSGVESERVQKILVEPHPRNEKFLKMYWSRAEPIEDFKANSVIMLIFISFEIFLVLLGAWLGIRKMRVG